MLYFLYGQYLVNGEEANDFDKENQIFKMIYSQINTFGVWIRFAKNPKEIMPKRWVVHF